MLHLLHLPVQFRNDSVYVNIHTTANPNGEIRGQVRRGYVCTNTTTGVDENSLTEISKINLYPNPASDKMYLSFNSSSSNNAEIFIYDAVGKEVFKEKTKLISGNNIKSIEVKNLDNGIYFMKIKNGENQVTQKFIKK